MLTVYHQQSSFKKKFSVVIIWILAAVMLSALIYFLKHTELSMAVVALPAFIGLVGIAAILLRCKVGRAFTLVGIYTMMLFPFLSLITGSGVINLTQAIYSVLFGLLFIYVLSNEKAMDIYYIESNPKEHLFYLLIAVGLLALYVKFV
jgi:hypothetical protein